MEKSNRSKSPMSCKRIHIPSIVNKIPGTTFTVWAEFGSVNVRFTPSVGLKDGTTSGTICAAEKAVVKLFKLGMAV